MMRVLLASVAMSLGACMCPAQAPDARPAQLCDRPGECRQDAGVCDPAIIGACVVQDAAPATDADWRISCAPDSPCPNAYCCVDGYCAYDPADPLRCLYDAGQPALDADTRRPCDCDRPCQNGLCCEGGYCLVPQDEPLRCVYDDATLVPDAGVCP